MGVFRSTDSGASWTLRGGGIRNFGFRDGFSHLAIDPQQPATLYLVRSLNPDDLLKTTDGGGTWTPVLGGLDNPRAVAVHPVAHQTVYVTASQEVSVSADGGATWQTTAVLHADNFGINTLALDPVDPATAYVGTYVGTEGGLYKTTDRGLTWHLSNTGLPNDDVLSLAVDPSNPLALFASTFSSTFHSADGGATWTESLTPAPCVYYDAVRADPSTPGRAYAATCSGVFVTSDGGVTWGPTGAGITVGQTFAVGPGPGGIAYAGSAGHGVFRSLDAGATWTAQSQGLAAQRVTTFVTLPNSAATIYAGTKQDGLLKTTDGGATWARADAGITYAGPETVDFVTMDPQTPTTLYATVAGHIFKSADAGGSWSAAESGLPSGRYVRTLSVDPLTPTTLYAGVGVGVAGVSLVYKSTDAGASWVSTPLISTSALAQINVIVVDPVTPSKVYAGGGRGAVVARSTDGGASWTPVTVSFPGFQVLALVIDPQHPSTLYAGTQSNFLWRSLDAGVTWTQLSSPSYLIAALALDSAEPAHLFLSMELSIQASLDAGTTYADVTGDLPDNVALYVVSGLALDPQDPTRLLAGTDGAGIQVGLLVPCANDADCGLEADLCQIGTCAPSSPAADAYGCVRTPRQCTAGECQIAGTCDPETGVCPIEPVPDGGPCPDAISCTIDSCHSGVCRHDVVLRTSCFEPVSRGGSTLTVHDATSAKANLTWKWGKGDAFDIPNLGNPFETNRTDYAVCVVDHGGPGGALRLVLEADVPGGETCGRRPCWAARNLDITYADRSLSADGIRSIRFHSGIAGKASVRVTAKGPTLPFVTAPPFAPGVVVELRRQDSGVCWQATFDQLVRRNQAGLFTAKSGTN